MEKRASKLRENRLNYLQIFEKTSQKGVFRHFLENLKIVFFSARAPQSILLYVLGSFRPKSTSQKNTKRRHLKYFFEAKRQSRLRQ